VAGSCLVKEQAIPVVQRVERRTYTQRVIRLPSGRTYEEHHATECPARVYASTPVWGELKHKAKSRLVSPPLFSLYYCKHSLFSACPKMTLPDLEPKRDHTQVHQLTDQGKRTPARHIGEQQLRLTRRSADDRVQEAGTLPNKKTGPKGPARIYIKCSMQSDQ